MPRKKKTAEEAEALRFENEFLKAKIVAELGGIHMDANPNEDTPPEIENEFLKNIIKFEEARNFGNEIPLYEFIGKPEFVKEADLSDEKLPAELERINDLLYAKNIACETICPVDNRVLYKFLTEELFQLKVQDEFIPGMTTHYIYEEFHPNHEYDTRRECEDFIEAFFADEFQDRIRFCFPDHIRNFAALSEFRNSFHEFRNIKSEILPSEVTPSDCTRTARLSFDAITSAGTIPIHYSGVATFQLAFKGDYWNLTSIVLPGMTAGK